MIQSFSIHRVGNKSADEPMRLSKQEVKLNDELQNILSQYFLSSFKSEEYYRFYHTIELSLNGVYTCISKVFENPRSLHEQSVNLAKHLYDKSTHPKIKGGEFYVAYFKDCHLNGETMDAVGLFKSENKDTYIEVEPVTDGFDIESRQGININKLDKGCLIFNTEKENGFILSIVDNTNKATEAQYWKDDFLSVLVLNNDFTQTNQFLGITKQFVTSQIDEDFEMSKADKIDLLNRSVDYFKKHDRFDKEEFEQEVFFHPNVIESFQKFDQHYRRENAVEPADSFEISAQAVKQQARAFKSVLKLDKNFHIYIHGNRELIEQGIDENGRKYYKIYYEHEA
ncbi:nucleoid-associated protein [Parafilimonas sp.]|uniref:nucleoid-associated protein n=1 Tax=Parafilimonas sp. TaxID=1969739 RepID=UPI0039E3D702